MAAILDGGKLTLTGDVGDFYFGDGFTHSDVVIALAQVDDEAALTVYLNSGGGYASEGAAIHALLSRRAGQTDVVVDGVAASAASLIAMAGNTVTMSAGAVMMIHDPAVFTVGNSDDHAKSVEYLEALATSYARVYADKSGKSPEECRAIMKAERWFSPDDAVSEGFADRAAEAQASAVAAFDYRAYAHAPQRLKALASRKNWRLPDADQRAATSAAPRQKEEPSMTDKERADQLAAELATMRTRAETAETAAATASDNAVKADRERRAAIMALDEAKGREQLADHLYATGASVDSAKATLAVSPKAAGASDTAGEVTPGEFGAARMSADGIAQPGGQTTPGKANRAVLSAAVDRTNARRKR
ncbi:Clp protease [Aurantimonas phage AmM-1]|uniref:head maturation protease n=1 Tax=Aurantimonas phage AmM-1 TaxID=1503929 RepID=UPI00054091DC|nr:head maturation protease [Aurantimonas phage AmM-1]BAP94462.1 Clp protease [Aurantimonas phage AmM-1]